MNLWFTRDKLDVCPHWRRWANKQGRYALWTGSRPTLGEKGFWEDADDGRQLTRCRVCPPVDELKIKHGSCVAVQLAWRDIF